MSSDNDPAKDLQDSEETDLNLEGETAARAPDTEGPDTESQDTQSQDTKSQDTKSQDTKSQDTESQDTESQDTQNHDTESQDTESQDTESQDTESQDTESQDTESHDTESHDTESQDTESQDTESNVGVRSLTPFDLVALPREKRRLITWLTRRKTATLNEIISELGGDSSEQEVANTLEDLLSSGYIETIEVEGESRFRCQVRGHSGRRLSGMRDDIWSRIDGQDSEK